MIDPTLNVHLVTSKGNSTTNGGASVSVRLDSALILVEPYDYAADDAHDHAIRAVFGNITIVSREPFRNGYRYTINPATAGQ